MAARFSWTIIWVASALLGAPIAAIAQSQPAASPAQSQPAKSSAQPQAAKSSGQPQPAKASAQPSPAKSAAQPQPAQASAQPSPAQGPPNALQGFSKNRDQPIQIDSDALEVRDKDKVATFSGSVQLVQGDTVLRCNKMVVFYVGDAKTTTPKEGDGQQNIRRIEVLGDVVVTQKDQKATAEKGFFEMKTNTITLVGNVVISQGQNVVKGDRLSVDLTTSVSRVECEKSSQCRVQALLQPGGKDVGPVGPGSLLKPTPAGGSGL